MNLNEAYVKLDLTPDATEDDVKKRFRELSKKWHPDKNQNNPEAEIKFKEINSAYQRIINPNERERYQDAPQDNPFQGFDFSGIGGNPFGIPFQQRRRQASPIQITTTISFQESILGCKKDIKYNRNIKCNTCEGQGSIKINTDCKKCGGTGSVVQRSSNMMFVKQCECSINQKSKKCTSCNDGIISSESSVNVQVPGGVSNESVLRLQGMGNYASSRGHFDQYSDVFLILNVVPDPDLTLENDNVIFNLNISLLEAIKGVKKNIKTVVGDKEIIIKPLSKNKEEVIIPHVGVNGKGDQRVILNVSYPDNVDLLIKSLE